MHLPEMRRNSSRLPALVISIALHVLIIGVVVHISLPRMRRGALGSSRQQQAALAAQVAQQDARPRPSAHKPPPESVIVRPEPDATILPIPGFTFDVGRIAARATALFPFLSFDLQLERVVSTVKETGAASLANPFALVDREGAKPPLVLTEAALQGRVDRAWSRRDRWQAFLPILALTNAYSGDEGRLPDLLRGYVDQNVLQPFVDTTIPDPRLWTELGIAAEHADFVRAITNYAASHPSTRATTELLFLLDKLAQASFDSLTLLLDTRREDLRWTSDSNPQALRLITSIREYYIEALSRQGLLSHPDLLNYYDRVRLTILKGILRTTPDDYRSSDARFLIGSIYWREGNVVEAFRFWQEMIVEPKDTAIAAYSKIIAATARGGIDTDRINGILNAEQDRWLRSSTARVRKFGYQLDAF